MVPPNVHFAIIVSFLFSLSIKYKEKCKIKYILLFSLSLLIISLYIGLRYDVGTDFISYTNLYYKIIYLDLFSYLNLDLEIGHYIICKISNLLFNGSYGMMILYAFFTNFFVMKAIEQITKRNFWLSYLIYLLTFLPFACNGIRQGLSMSIILYSFSFFNDKKYLKFYLLVFFALLFHKTSIIIVPYSLIGILFKKKGKDYKYYILITILILILLFSGRFSTYSVM